MNKEYTMKPGKVCLSVLLAVWAFAAAHAEIYTARILCEKEIPAYAAGAVITVTDEAYSAEADIPFTVEWILSSYDADGKPAEGESAASPDMVITDDGRLYCADSDEISGGLIDVLRSAVEDENGTHSRQPEKILADAADCLHPGIVLDRCADCSAIRLSLSEIGH